MRHPYRTAILTIAAVGLLCGCSIRYDYALQINVTNVETGQPLEGVTGLIDEYGDRDDLERGTPLEGQSDAAGLLRSDYGASNTSKGQWRVKLHKDGFAPVAVEVPVDPRDSPKPKERFVLTVTAQMKPRRPDPNGANPEHERR
jgi:hypothetical protein